MAELASDSFDRANNADLGSDWSPVFGLGSLKIDGNAACATSENTDTIEVYTAVTWPDDQWSEVTLQAVSANARPGPTVRGSTSVGDQYTVECSNSTIFIWKQLGGSWSTPANYVGAVSGTDVVKIEAQGTTLRVFQNGVQRISTTDPDIASGNAGCGAYVDGGGGVTNGKIASWRGGDFNTGGYTLACDPGSYAVTGIDAVLKAARKLTADAGSYSVTGSAASLLAARLLSADPGSYAVTGLDATLTATGLTHYTLSADTGLYTVTGSDAALLATRLLTADEGSYLVSGEVLNLLKGYVLTADAGSYVVSGSDAAFPRAYVLNAESGTYTIQGRDATLTYSASPTPSGDFYVMLRRRKR